MKNSLIILLSTLTVAHSAVIQFNLSPPGTDAAVGLSPTNETTAVINSTGSGNAISGGIAFDTATETLTFAIGYGSAAGFTDLTQPATGLHIHGPAAAGQPAGVLFSLAPFHFPAADPMKGGVIFGSIVYPTSQVPDLLAGRNYVNIHTATNPGGEIRGQLIPALNDAPVVVCPPATAVECGSPVTVTVSVSDAEGEAMVAVWQVNGVPAQTNHVAAGGPPVAATISFTAELPLGANQIDFMATDSAGNATSCSTTVTVTDLTPPIITSVSATPDYLWPPNHKLVPVLVKVLATDNCGSPTWKIISVASNEAVNDKGDGNTAPDWEIVSDHAVKLRSERSGKGAGRVYTITVQAKDAAGNLSELKTVEVTVPHDRSKKNRPPGHSKK